MISTLVLCLALRIVDGDTIRCGAERVRVYGLDCAEMRDPGGPAAKRALAILLGGRRVEIERIERDRYGRTVAKVFADGRDVICLMIRGGACRWYERYDKRREYAGCRP